MIKEVISGLALYEGIAWWTRRDRRTALYGIAQTRAKQLSRPLVVVGDPDGGVTAGYGYGDFCVDLTGCPKAPHGIKADITKPLPFAADSSVVFVSCTLEYVDDLAAAWKELRRIAGDTQNLFIVTVQMATITAFFYPGAKWRIIQAPPESPQLLAQALTSDAHLALRGLPRNLSGLRIV